MNRNMKAAIGILCLLIAFIVVVIITSNHDSDKTTNEQEVSTPTPFVKEDFANQPENNPITDDSSLSQALTFSLPGGSYEQSIQLELYSDKEGTIYYTLDGSNPDASSIPYTKAIEITNCASQPMKYSSRKDISPTSYNRSGSGKERYINQFVPNNNDVDKCTIVRAILIDKEGNQSDVITQTYFVGNDLANTYHNLPVISLVTDPDNLFDYNTGIYCLGRVFDDFYKNNDLSKRTDSWAWEGNYSLRGKEAERPAVLQYFNENGDLVFTQGVGIRIHGGASRTYLQKSFRLYARAEYDKEEQKKFTFNFFEDNTNEAGDLISEYKKVILRNGGNDNEYTKFKDCFIQELVNDREFATQKATPCIVYLDGEYWGVYSITECFDNNYLESHYGVDKDNVVVIKNGSIDEGTEEDYSLYQKLTDYITDKDFSYNVNYINLSEFIDMRSLIDYYATQLYIGNADWPNNNVQLWRTREKEDNIYGDCKWRYMLFDTEFSFDHYMGNNFSVDYDNISRAKDSDLIFQSLMKNQNFQKDLSLTILDLANINFSPNVYEPLLEEYVSTYRPVMDDFFKRFSSWSNLEWTFDVHIEYMKNYMYKRQTAILSVIQHAMEDAGEAVLVKLQSNYGNKELIKINTVIPDMSQGSWQGNYLTGYEITLTAMEVEGKTFDHWEITGGKINNTNSVNAIATLEQENVTITAIYK